MKCCMFGAFRLGILKTYETNHKGAAVRLLCDYKSTAKPVGSGRLGCSDGGANPPTSTLINEAEIQKENFYF